MNNQIIILKNNSGHLLENEYEKIGLDMWQLIADNSSLLSVILLRSCSKFLLNLKTKDKERVCKELQDKNIRKNPEFFCEMIRENHFLISGSFVLSCILGWEFEYNDVDIYLKIDEKFTKRMNFKEIINTKTKEISASNLYIYNLGKLSFISITKNIKNHINYFDLDVCKNYFDGEKIYIKNLEKIIKKEDEFNMNSLINKITEFYDYIHSEYDLKNANKELIIKYEEDINEYIHKNYIKNRIKKYENRGFKIKYDEIMIKKYLKNIKIT